MCLVVYDNPSLSISGEGNPGRVDQRGRKDVSFADRRIRHKTYILIMELGELQPIELVDAVVGVSGEYTVLRRKRVIYSGLIKVFRGGLVKSEGKLVSRTVRVKKQVYQVVSGG